MFATLLIWNVVLAALMAVFVTVVGGTRYMREHPAFRHCLWLLVLCKLVTPPLVPLPVLVPNSVTVVADFDEPNSPETSAPNALHLDTPYAVAAKGMQEDARTQSDSRPRSPDRSIQSAVSMRPINWLVVLCSNSLAVTVVLVVSLFAQLRRMSRLLRRGDWGSTKVNAIARREARRMGVRQVPGVCVVNSVITPLLWIGHARPVVVLPDSLLSQFTDEQLACVVKHKLAHFIRRDHWSNALACFVGCLFWWNPIVWWARRELRVAQEACCDAMVIDGTPTSRRAYAETLLQVIEFVGRKHAAPQLTSGFGEALSITRRFEMIANARVTHRLSRLTGLLVAALFGMACCYPVLAQPTNNSDFDQADRFGNDATKALNYDVQFEWKHAATTTFKYLDNAKRKGVLTLRAEGYPESSLIKMMRAMHHAKSLTFARVTTEYPEHGSEFVTVVLKSEPFASTTLPLVILDLSKHFWIKQILVSPSLTVKPTQQEADGGPGSEKRRSDARLQKLQQEISNAIRSALPTDVDDTGWQIELQNYHYDATKDQASNNWVPHRQLIGNLADQDTTLVEEPADKNALDSTFYLLEKANKEEATRRINALKLRNADIVPDARANRILIIATAEQHKQVASLVSELERQPAKTDSRITESHRSPLNGHWIVQRTIHDGAEHAAAEQFKSYV